jgi:hypothetical protein
MFGVDGGAGHDSRVFRPGGVEVLVQPGVGAVLGNVRAEARLRLQPVVLVAAGEAAALDIKMPGVIADFLFGRME